MTHDEAPQTQDTPNAASHPDEAALMEYALASRQEPAAMLDTEMAAVGEHAVGCDACRTSVAEHRELLDLVAGSTDALVAPPDHVWDGIERHAELTAQEQSAPSDDVIPLAARRDRSRRRHGRPARRVLRPIGLVAAGLALVAGGWAASDALREKPQPVASSVMAQTPIRSLDAAATDRGHAVVIEHDGRMSLDVEAHDLPAGSGYLEVWLINTDGRRMVSVGILPDGADTVDLPVSRTLIDEGYVTVDISREPFDAKPQHSGDSLARGTLKLA